jgi:hypothetical protein
MPINYGMCSSDGLVYPRNNTGFISARPAEQIESLHSDPLKSVATAMAGNAPHLADNAAMAIFDFHFSPSYLSSSRHL